MIRSIPLNSFHLGPGALRNSPSHSDGVGVGEETLGASAAAAQSGRRTSVSRRDGKRQDIRNASPSSRRSGVSLMLVRPLRWRRFCPEPSRREPPHRTVRF
jgi:hypothetical protein